MIAEIAHQMALVPILAMMLIGLSGKSLSRTYWLLALAFSVSWFGDSLSYASGGAWYWTYLWMPLQLWLICLAFMRDPLNRVSSLGALIFLAALSWAVSGPGPDILLTVAGSIWIILLAEGRMAPAIHIYFGLGTVAYLSMVVAPDSHVLLAWYVHQVSRMIAYAIFLGVAFRSRLGSWSPHVTVHN